MPHAFLAVVASSRVDNLPLMHAEASAATEEYGRIESCGAISLLIDAASTCYKELQCGLCSCSAMVEVYGNRIRDE